jgi:hypothetical protein
MDDGEFKASLSYVVRPYLKKQKQKQKKPSVCRVSSELIIPYNLCLKSLFIRKK